MEKNNYKLKISPKAYNDLKQIYQYITFELLNETAAKNIMNKIENRIMNLQSYPYVYGFVKDTLLSNKGYRKLVIDNYLVFYIIEEMKKEVIVMRVLNHRQNYNYLI